MSRERESFPDEYSIRVSKSENDNIEEILRLFKSTDGFDDSDYQIKLIQDLQNQGLIFECVDTSKQNKLMGAVAMYPISDNTIFIDRLTVELKHRRFGIGKKLIESVVQFGQDNDVSKVMLVSTSKAKGFYKKLGFVCTDKGYSIFEKDL